MGRTRVLPPAGASLAPAAADLLPLFTGSGKRAAAGRAEGIPPVPQTHLPGGAPQTSGKLWGAAWSGSTSPGLPGEGGGLPWKG